MAIPLLKTKLYIPLVRPELVSRPRLIERLNAGLQRAPSVTLISAPAGFGKTTLLSEWVHHCRGKPGACSPAAWLSLDEGDNDHVRFWSYFVAALQTIQADIGEAALALLHAPQPPSVESVLTLLINEITSVVEDDHEGHPYILVLDDYHVIKAQPIHNALAFLLAHLPPQMHLVVASRADPPLPLSRLRGQGRLTELRTADLRFTPDEATAFLNRVMGLRLSAKDVAALEARTEGWIVGLQLAALSLQGQHPTRVADFIAAFTGSHRYVLDYLTEEVLHRQPENVQTFLLQTSILERMCGPLCDAVLGRGKMENGRMEERTPGFDPSIYRPSSIVLEYLERTNLFVVPLDDHRGWYRYHHLFADLLRSYLMQNRPGQVTTLHHRASEWYEQHEFIAEAVGHALGAGDIERAACLIERNAITMLDRGELTETMLARWLDALPDEVVRTRPWLHVARAWALTYAGQLGAVEPLLQGAESALETLGPSHAPGTVEGQRIAGYIAAIRAYVEQQQGDMSLAIELAREALECLPEEDRLARAFTMGNLSTMLRLSGDFAASTQVLTEAIAISQTAGDSYTAVIAICALAGLQIVQGQLHEAAATYQAALRLTDERVQRDGRRLPIAGYAHTRLSQVLCEWNDLEAALHHASQGPELCRRWGHTDNLVVCYLDLARVLQAIGDADGALHAIQEAKQTARNLTASWVANVEAWEAWLRLMQGDTEAASRWAAWQTSALSLAELVGLQGGLNFQRATQCLILARILVAQGQLEEALELLARLLQMTEATGARGYVIEILVLQALALQAQGELGQALVALTRALALAEPEGYVRVFVNEGAPMSTLLQQAAVRGIAVDYVGKLLAAFGVSEYGSVGEVRPRSHTPTVIEPLSNRELEVLRLLAAGLSNREIARILVVAPNTVKNHLQSIYGKLDVHSRTQAVHRARELNLL